jgi:hypothetical protein
VNRNVGLVGGALVILGVLWLLDALDVVDVLRWSVIWPVLVIAVGTSMIVTGLKGRSAKRHPLTEPDLSEVVVLGDRDLVAGPTFSGGSVTAVLADVDLDLRGTELVSSPATLVVTAVLGEVDVHVPPTWRVQTSGSALLSEVKVRREGAHPDGDAPELIVQTSGVFGDVKVR